MLKRFGYILIQARASFSCRSCRQSFAAGTPGYVHVMYRMDPGIPTECVDCFEAQQVIRSFTSTFEE